MTNRHNMNDESAEERSMAMRYLTKSRFKLAMEYPTKLFYTGKSKTYKNIKGENEFLESLAENGLSR